MSWQAKLVESVENGPVMDMRQSFAVTHTGPTMW
jgi:hypothetical protein